MGRKPPIKIESASLAEGHPTLLSHVNPGCPTCQSAVYDPSGAVAPALLRKCAHCGHYFRIVHKSTLYLTQECDQDVPTEDPTHA